MNMLGLSRSSVMQRLRSVMRRKRALHIQFVRSGNGWLTENLPAPSFAPPRPEEFDLIEARAAASEQEGPKPLWEGYKQARKYPRAILGSRTSNQVRSSSMMGCFFSWLAAARAPNLIVEFGTAFGVSGMYWLAGLKQMGGELLTFEPNRVWAEIARVNLQTIKDDQVVTVGTFEDEIGKNIGSRKIGIGFIDAIHTSDFVNRQLEVLLDYTEPGAIILLDDIGFSNDMKNCWNDISVRPDVSASATLDGRIGIIELKT
jgi:predicted O-methyltransferase YrrM